MTRQKKDAKHVKNNACKRILIDQEVSRCYQANLDGSKSCREAVEGIEAFSIDPPCCREGVEIAIRNSLRA